MGSFRFRPYLSLDELACFFDDTLDDTEDEC
jgi:hypothetical protein